MNTDLLRETFQELEQTSPTLDPAQVIAGARRRGVRRRAVATGAAALGTAVAVAAGSALVRPVTDPVAPSSAPTPSSTATSTTPVETPPPPVVTPPPPADSLPVPAPPPMVDAGGWVPLSGRGRFRLIGPKWQLFYPGFGVVNSVSGDILSRGWDVSLGFPNERDRVSFSLLRGDIRRVVYTGATAAGNVRAEARVLRLTTLPGWVMADAAYRVDGKPDPWGGLYVQATLDAYDGSGRRVLHCQSRSSGGTCTTV